MIGGPGHVISFFCIFPLPRGRATDVPLLRPVAFLHVGMPAAGLKSTGRHGRPQPPAGGVLVQNKSVN